MSFVIVRDHRAGVYFGQIARRRDKSIVLKNARHIYYWQGRLSTADIAARGVADGSKVVTAVPSIELFDVISVMTCEPEAAKQIAEFKPWKQ